MTNPDPTPEHLRLYSDPNYFKNGRTCSGYDDYANCVGVLNRYSEMLNTAFKPASVLDVGAAYGFVVHYFKNLGIPAYGIEPSPVARSHVNPALAGFILPGALPDLPPLGGGFDLVTCTEVLEHVPEALVPASLQALANCVAPGGRFIGLIMLEGPGADGDEGHICLKSRDWWENELDVTGLVHNEGIEDWFNEHDYSRAMYWSTRFFVRRKL